MLFPLYPIIFGEIHNLRPGIADLPFLATLGGVLIAINITVLYQRKYMKDLQRAGGKHTPELRLPPAYMGGPVMLIALVSKGLVSTLLHTSTRSDLGPSVRSAVARLVRLQVDRVPSRTSSIWFPDGDSLRAHLQVLLLLRPGVLQGVLGQRHGFCGRLPESFWRWPSLGRGAHGPESESETMLKESQAALNHRVAD